MLLNCQINLRSIETITQPTEEEISILKDNAQLVSAKIDAKIFATTFTQKCQVNGAS